MKLAIMDYDQKAAVALGLDMNDILLLRWFTDFKGTELMKYIVVGEQVFYWVSYQTVIDELPILGISNRDVMRRRFKKICDTGIMTFHCERNKTGTYTYYNTTRKYVLLTNYNRDA